MLSIFFLTHSLLFDKFHVGRRKFFVRPTLFSGFPISYKIHSIINGVKKSIYITNSSLKNMKRNEMKPICPSVNSISLH